MRRLTITFEDDIYYPIYNLAKEEHTSFRNIVMSILRNEIYKPKEMTDIKTIDNEIKECLYLLNEIKKKQKSHYKLSEQLFVNHGYLANANPKESKSYQELLESSKNKFND